MINKLHRLFLATVVSYGLLMVLSPVYGQDFQPGYILSGGITDTLRGEVQQLGVRRTQRQCVFRTSTAGVATTYSPVELRGYGLIAGAQFRRCRVPLGSADTISALRFAEVLVQGRATLLYAADDNASPHFFLQMNNNSLVIIELRVVKRRIEQNGTAFTQTINVYQQTLLTALVDCPMLQNKIRTLGFTEAALVSIVQRYNTCTAPVGALITASSVVPTKTTVGLSLLAGAALQQEMRLRNDVGQPVYNATLTAPVAAVLGLQLDVRNPRLSRHFCFSAGAFLQRTSYRATVSVKSAFTLADFVDISYAADFLDIPVGVRYEIGRGKVLPFMEVAFYQGLRVAEHRNEYTVTYTDRTYPSTHEVLFEKAHAYSYGMLLGAGISTHRPAGHDVGVRARYEFQSGVSSYFFVRSNTSQYTVLLSFNLLK